MQSIHSLLVNVTNDIHFGAVRIRSILSVSNVGSLLSVIELSLIGITLQASIIHPEMSLGPLPQTLQHKRDENDGIVAIHPPPSVNCV